MIDDHGFAMNGAHAATAVLRAAPAKLNLYLHVLGRRPDGYHDLDSLVVFADIGDTVAVRPDGRMTLTVDGPFGDGLAGLDPGTNLVGRAAAGLAAALGRPPSVAIALTKVLPVASGIGGGSADAAACLRALCALWDIAEDDPRVRTVAASLGADVPVCLSGRAAHISGVGEHVEAVPDLPDCHVVLVNPGVPVATPAVFARRAGPFSRAGRLDDLPVTARALAAALADRKNDLTDAALSVAPVIATVLDALAATEVCLLARLSGSGATCFGLYETAAAAEAAAATLSQRHPLWWVRPGRLIRDIRTLDPAGG